MELSVPDLFGLLLRSRLMPIDDARAMYQRWLQESGDAAMDPVAFSRWVPEQGYLTTYQVNLLRKGHADGFFLQHYKILDRLGKGKMAGVYKAVHDLGQVVALKVLPPSRAQDPHLLGRFRREARLAMRLHHPNIVRAFQTGEADGLHYLVMEHLDGVPLSHILDQRGNFPAVEAVRLIHQTLQGLQHIHEQGLVHRDLKPANLMLVPAPLEGGDTSGCTVKIVDIGLGRALLEEAGQEPMDDIQLTGASSFLGTPDYIAPEQARDARTADIRSDIYSLGCVLYHLLAGQPVFPDTNLINQLVRHATEPPHPLREFNPEVTDELQQIINAMLAKEPAARYQTPERAARALQAFLDHLGSAPPTPEDSVVLTEYLSWLEESGTRPGPTREAAPPEEPGQPASDVRQAAENIISPVESLRAARQAATERRRRSRRHRVKPPPLPPADPLFPDPPDREKTRQPRPRPATARDREFFSEKLGERDSPPRALALTKRDLILFTLGALGASLAILLARIAVILLP